jgi:hypothetical protein
MDGPAPTIHWTEKSIRPTHRAAHLERKPTSFSCALGMTSTIGGAIGRAINHNRTGMALIDRNMLPSGLRDAREFSTRS